MTEISASADQPARTETRIAPGRYATARRRTARALTWGLNQLDWMVPLAVLALALLWVLHIGPAWIAHVSYWRFALYALAGFGAVRILAEMTETAIDLVDPDRWDGDVAFEATKSISELRADIDMGADPGDVLDSLKDSGLLCEQTDTFRTLAEVYAADGDEDQAQTLYAVVLHLRKADETLGHRQVSDAFKAVETAEAGRP
ncbi:hypothetical protein [Streptomyces mirabilis]|uniref:hypothetical protein n=1 Tax=Streptomyces mirabilis TaxID=68239 RepID=UPI00369BDE57